MYTHRLARIAFLTLALLLALAGSAASQTADPPSSSQAQPAAQVAAPSTYSQGVEPGLALPFAEPAAPAAASLAYYNVPASVFTPVESAVGYTYNLMGCIRVTANPGILFNAPLLLPQGAVIKQHTIYFVDSSTGAVSSWITRYPNGGTTFADLTSVSSSGTPGRSSLNSAVITHSVDNVNNNYVLNFRVSAADGNLQVCGMRVAFIPPAGCCAYLPHTIR